MSIVAEPFDTGLPPNLKAMVRSLEEKAKDEGVPQHYRDVFLAIRDCIIGHNPIPKDLQEQYVQYLANEQSQDKYGH